MLGFMDVSLCVARTYVYNPPPKFLNPTVDLVKLLKDVFKFIQCNGGCHFKRGLLSNTQTF